MTRICLTIAMISFCACTPTPRPPVSRNVPDAPKATDHAGENTVGEPSGTRVESEDIAPPPSLVGPAAKLHRPVDAVLAEVNGQLQDVYFAYDRSEPGVQTLAALEHNAGLILQVLVDFPGVRVIVEGHCDERGSAEYNLALGDRRATRAREVLHQYGVPEPSMTVVSFGKEIPQCVESNETCWSRNRRAHLVMRLPRSPTD